jgi:phage-related tail fiber protein
MVMPTVGTDEFFMFTSVKKASTDTFNTKVVTIKDTISVSKGNNDGVSLCLGRTYTLQNPYDTTITSPTTNSATISLSTTVNSSITTLDTSPTFVSSSKYYKEVILKACLTNYNTICGTYTFRVYIEPCKVTTPYTVLPTSYWIIGHTSTDLSVLGT